MSDIAINPVTRRVQFTGNTGTGPFAFTFNILTDSDIAVFKNTTELTLTTDYTVSINANGTGSITLAAALIVSDVLTIIGGRELSRTTDFVTAGDLLASSLNEQLDSNVIMTQQLDEKLGRGLFVNPGDVFTDLELPLKDARKGTVLGFNATTGDPEPGPEIGDVDSLANISADIKTLAEIQDGTVATDAITNVNTIRANVTTVSGISGNVTTVAGNTTNINSVAGNSANINTVAGIDSDVTTVSGISGNVTAVAGNTSNINTVAADGADIGTVATSIASVNTVATDISNVNTNATNIASINTNATNITDIQNASTNAASALASKNAAATSATNSANSATASETSKVASVAAQAAAETAETNAETAETNAETAKTNAAASASSASASASSASTSSSTATTQAGVATTKAGEAAASATASANSATASEAAKDAALAALDNFDDRYLGAKASDPTLDNDGNPLVSGALYFNTTDDVMKVYTGSQWVAAYASLSGALLVNNNLSDVADAAGSRTNLGLGTGDTPTFAGINTTGNATFGDNDKAIFGAGSDLQIYHDGSNSFISDQGTGQLTLLGSNAIALNNAANTENMLVAFENGSVDLYYDNSKKLATTSTGVDITGTITSDALRVDGNLGVNRTATGQSGFSIIDVGGAAVSGLLDLRQNDVRQTRIYNSSSDTIIRNDGGDIYLQPDETTAIRIQDGGDISFFEDTGTTPKFFWDSSAESLGIGTSAPSTYGDLALYGGGTNKTLAIIEGSISPANNDTYGSLAFGGRTDGTITAKISGLAGNNTNGTDGQLAFYTADNTAGSGSLSERLRISSSGAVGIGVTPSAWSTFNVLEMSNGVYLGSYTGGTTAGYLGTNNYFNGSNFIYKNSDFATRYQQVDGKHQWFTAPSGTAGNSISFSQAMTLDASGNFLVGKTSTNYQTVGVEAKGNGSLWATADGNGPLVVTRKTSDGTLADFYKDTSHLGSIRAVGTQIAYSAASEGLLSIGSFNYYRWNTSEFEPVTSNSRDLGSSTYKWKDGHFGSTVNAANFNTTSDATLKTNVETLTGSLDAVKAMRGVSYDWIENGNSEVGVIAQEVEAIVPDVVSTNDEGIKSVKYGNMVAVLIEAIKEQQAQIDELKAKQGD